MLWKRVKQIYIGKCEISVQTEEEVLWDQILQPHFPDSFKAPGIY